MRRLFVSLVALLVAITAGTVFLAVAGLAVPETRGLAAELGIGPALAILAGLADGDGPDRVWSAVAFAVWVLVIAIIVAPPVLTALAGAFGGFRSFAFYGGATGLVAVAFALLGHAAGAPPAASESKVLLLVFCTGAVTGLTYWALAARDQGRAPAGA